MTTAKLGSTKPISRHSSLTLSPRPYNCSRERPWITVGTASPAIIGGQRLKDRLMKRSSTRMNNWLGRWRSSWNSRMASRLATTSPFSNLMWSCHRSFLLLPNLLPWNRGIKISRNLGSNMEIQGLLNRSSKVHILWVASISCLIWIKIKEGLGRIVCRN